MKNNSQLNKDLQNFVWVLNFDMQVNITFVFVYACWEKTTPKGVLGTIDFVLLKVPTPARLHRWYQIKSHAYSKAKYFKSKTWRRSSSELLKHQCHGEQQFLCAVSHTVRMSLGTFAPYLRRKWCECSR